MVRDHNIRVSDFLVEKIRCVTIFVVYPRLEILDELEVVELVLRRRRVPRKPECSPEEALVVDDGGYAWP